MHPTLKSIRVNPFSLQIGPEKAIAHPAWQQARAAALHTLGAGGSAFLLGLPGSGKSLLLKDLAETLRNAGNPVRLVAQPDALGRIGRDEILLVDEADKLGSDHLAVLRDGSGPVLLAATPASPIPGLLEPRPFRRIILERLLPEDVARFVATRLAGAGQPTNLLEPAAVLALARHSGGLPWLVNAIAGSAVSLARLDRSLHVTAAHVDEASAMRSAYTADAAMPNAGPEPVEPASRLLQYRPVLTSRRSATGGLIIAFGAALSLPWLTSKRGVNPPQTLDAPAPTSPTSAVAGDELSNPPGVITPPTDASAQTAPRSAAAADAGPGTVAPVARPAEPRTTASTSSSTTFHGPIFNQTMGQGGRLALTIVRHGKEDAILAQFAASQGLSGNGVLAGKMTGAGQLVASGRLLMGKNLFTCDLVGTLDSNMLTGSATFTRSGSNAVYRSSFNLQRT